MHTPSTPPVVTPTLAATVASMGANRLWAALIAVHRLAQQAGSHLGRQLAETADSAFFRGFHIA
jgi:hypothetical protein